jgi:6-phosphogluconolactonase/glucosamine-6-phosphate isomerase/deaminase
MEIHKLSSRESAVNEIKSLIQYEAHKSPVLLLLPGGSASIIASQVLSSLTKAELSKITVSLTDERYGPVGHSDSNLKLLNTLGMPKSDELKIIPVLTNKNPEETKIAWAKNLESLRKSHAVIGLFGIGNDYHIAGIKPGAEFDDVSLTEFYTADDFERITITPRFFKEIDLAIVYAEGEEKVDAIDQISKNNDRRLQPMQLVKDSGRALVYHIQ